MKIFRKRYIPNEVVDISGDEVLFQDDEMIVTKWVPIHPRADISSGISYTLLNRGWKISKFYAPDGSLAYWYCDIIEAEFKEDTLTTTDLLVDIKVYPDGSYKVLDIEELDEAVEQSWITKEQKADAIKKLEGLIKIIEDNKFPPMNEVV